MLIKEEMREWLTRKIKKLFFFAAQSSETHDDCSTQASTQFMADIFRPTTIRSVLNRCIALSSYVASASLINIIMCQIEPLI